MFGHAAPIDRSRPGRDDGRRRRASGVGRRASGVGRRASGVEVNPKPSRSDDDRSTSVVDAPHSRVSTHDAFALLTHTPHTHPEVRTTVDARA